MPIWGFPEIGVPLNHLFQWDFPMEINHPASLGYPILGNLHLSSIFVPLVFGRNWTHGEKTGGPSPSQDRRAGPVELDLDGSCFTNIVVSCNGTDQRGKKYIATFPMLFCCYGKSPDINQPDPTSKIWMFFVGTSHRLMT